MPTDESGLVHHLGYADSLNVAISICLTYTLIFTCIRIHLRKSSFGADDVIVIVATVTALVHFATSYACLTAGLGKPYDMVKDNIGRLSSIAEASAITFILSLYTAKTAALVFLMRIESKTRNPRLYIILIGVYMLFGVTSAIFVSAGCPSASGYYWDLAGNLTSCPTEKARWQAMTALDIISEIVLLALPVHLVYPLQMPRQRKLMIVITFWTRLPTIALALIRQTYTNRLRSQAHTDRSLDSTLVVILMSVELSYALISCTLTTSKNFTDGFSTGWGMGHIRGAADSYNLSQVQHSSQTRNTNTTNTRKSKAAKQKQQEQLASFASLGGGQHRFHVKTPSCEFEDADVAGALQLRPTRGVGESRAVVQAEQRYWGEGSSVSSEGEELGIVRHTEYTVSHDEAPILRQQSL